MWRNNEPRWRMPAMIHINATTALGLGKGIGLLIVWLRGKFQPTIASPTVAPFVLELYPAEWILNLKA
jgi:hypothetical protein